MTRKEYIINLAILISQGFDDSTCADAEYFEACEFLKSIGIGRERALSMTAVVGQFQEIGS
jgi:hypothetical protein